MVLLMLSLKVIPQARCLYSNRTESFYVLDGEKEFFYLCCYYYMMILNDAQDHEALQLSRNREG